MPAAGDTVSLNGLLGSVESETSTRYFWGMARNFEIEDAGVTARFKRQQGGVFTEDGVIEAQQRSIENNPGLKLRAYNIVHVGVKSRLIIERLRKGAVATAPATAEAAPARS